MKKRTLKIEEHIDPAIKYSPRSGPRAEYRCPKIRLKGKWLLAAGFSSGATVELTAISPGVIEIRMNPGSP